MTSVLVRKDASRQVDKGASMLVGMDERIDEDVKTVVRGATPRWPALVRRSMRSRRMEPLASTTRQMRGVALAETRPSTTTAGLALGVDVENGFPIFHDPFTLYGNDGFSSPNIVTFGDLGSGKSVSAKTWVLRNLMVGRRVVIVDKKLQALGDGTRAGEYSTLARTLGYTPITLKVGGGGTRINILDPLIAGESIDGVAGQQLLLETVASAAVGRSLNERERKALRVARENATRAAEQQGRIAHVGDVTHFLLEPVEQPMPGISGADVLADWGRDVAFALERMVTEELAGLIDGPTSEGVNVSSALTVFDISSLPDEGAAVGIMMSVLNTWLHAMIARSRETVPTLFVVDEAWHVAEGDFARIARKNAKLARGLGISNMTILQHPGDISPDSPAISMIKESQTAFVFRQDKADDAVAVCELFGWDVGEWAPLLQKLGTGICVVKIGAGRPLLCSWKVSDFELSVATTDAAMKSRATLTDAFHSLNEEDGERTRGQ